MSNFTLMRTDPLRDVNLAYSVLGVREVHHLEGGKETVSKIVAHYNVRLAAAMRTEFNSGGLRVADFWEEPGQPTGPARRFNATAAARQAQSGEVNK